MLTSFPPLYPCFFLEQVCAAGAPAEFDISFSIGPCRRFKSPFFPFQKVESLYSLSLSLFTIMKLKQFKEWPKKLMESSPRIVEMGALFECWASAGVNDKRCVLTARSFADCLAKPVCTDQVALLNTAC